MRWVARAFPVVPACLALAVTGPAVAAPPANAEACVAAYDRAVSHLDAGDDLDARAGFRECGASSCPSAVQRECIAQVAAVEQRVPTVLLAVRDEAHRDLSDVAVWLDGQPWKTRLDGREAEMNPGVHRLRFAAPGYRTFEASYVINEREKGRAIPVLLERASAATPAPAAEHTRADRTVPEYVLGAVGVLGLASWGGFGIAGLSARSDANDCRPNCTNGEAETANHRFLAADVSLGVGLVALAAAVWLELRRPRH